MLSEYAQNVYSYAGEDGMIEHLLYELNIDTGLCVEFGASDGVELSNTALLRDKGWSAILIEADDVWADKLINQIEARGESSTTCVKRIVQPTGPNSIDSILDGKKPHLMSIDIDGDDYFIFEAMQTRPEIVLIEYNQSVPWFLDVRASAVGNRFGASALSLTRLAEEKEYSLVGASETNLFFVDNQKNLGISPSYEEIMTELPLRCGIVVSNYTCDLLEINKGNLPKWGWQSQKPPDPLVIGPPLYAGNSKAVSQRSIEEREPIC